MSEFIDVDGVQVEIPEGAFLCAKFFDDDPCFYIIHDDGSIWSQCCVTGEKNESAWDSIGILTFHAKCQNERIIWKKE